MTATLRTIDPAAGHTVDAAGEPAQRLLREILAMPRPAQRHRGPSRSPRRIVLTAGVVGAAAVAAFVGVNLGSDGGSRLGSSAYAVSRDGDGTVHVDVRWSMVSDPSGLQSALDRAGARTKVFVLTDTGELCPPGDTVPYEAGAVDWHLPSSAGADDGIVLHPDRFPPDATFVLAVTLAPSGATGLSTLGPSAPSITGTLSYMTDGPVTSPAC